MGVLGLWQLLQPAGRPVSLQSLEGKVLAVDVSIWLHQAIKGMRDKDGGPMANAHLHVLFNRTCKLLYYKIKPIFVFDGAVPHLKKQTLAARRERRDFAELKSDKTSKKMVQNLIQSHAMQEVLGGDKKTKGPKPSSSASKPDMFELPPLPENFRGADSENEEEQNEWIQRNTILQVLEEEFQDLKDVDIDSEDFKNLPAEIQHEILSELKEKQKRLSRMNYDLPEDSNDFSKFQMSKILKQNHLSSRIDAVRKEMISHTSGEITVGLEDEFNDTDIQTRKIMSDDNSHFILIKGLSRKRRAEELARIEAERIDQEEEIREEDDVKIDNNDELLIDDDEDLDSKKIGGNSKNDVHSSTVCVKNKNLTPDEEIICEKGDKSGTGYDRGEITVSDTEENCTSSLAARSVGQSSEKTSVQRDITHGKNPTEELKLLQDIHKEKEISGHSRVEKTKVASTKRNENLLSDQRAPSREKRPKEDIRSETVIIDNDNEKSEDEGFIEVCINPQKASEDDLFPADLFSVTSVKSSVMLDNKTETNRNKDKQEVNVESVKESDNANSSDRQLSEQIVNTDTTEESTHEYASDNYLAQQYKSLTEVDLENFTEELQEEIKMLQQEKGKQDRLTTSITDQMHSEAQELLQLFGVPFIVSPTEAEAQCAQLDQANLSHGTITNDSDIWLFGGKRIYRNFFNQDHHVEYYTDSGVQSQLGLTRKILINIALLCGSDYTEGIAGVGPVTAMEILSEFPGQDITALEKFRAWWDEEHGKMKQIHERKLTSKLRQLEISPGFPSKTVMEAYLNPTIDDSDEQFTWAMPDLDQLRQFAADKLGWARSKADEILLPVMKKVNDKLMQPKINSFFQPENFVESQKSKSVRLKRALKKFHSSSPEKVPGSSTERKQQQDKNVVTNTKSKNTRKRKGVTKGKTPVKSKQTKGQSSSKRSVVKEVQLSESSSSDSEEKEDEILANLNYDDWIKKSEK